MADFDAFFKEFMGAIKSGDRQFIRKVYSEFDIEKEMSEEQFFRIISQMIGPLADRKPDSVESFDDFYIMHFREEGGELNLTFMKKGDSFVMYNEKANYSRFKKVYRIGYAIEGGGSVAIFFNGKRFPFLREIGASGFVSLINSALVAGENELTLIPPEKGQAKVSISISSAKEGDIMDSAQGDVLSWEGEVKEPVKLKFRAE
jgi:hypothetical protein